MKSIENLSAGMKNYTEQEVQVEMQVSLQCMLEKITYMEDRIRALSHVRGRWLQQQMEQEEVKYQMEQWKLMKTSLQRCLINQVQIHGKCKDNVMKSFEHAMNM